MATKNTAAKKLNSESLDSVMKYMGSLITLKDIVLAPTKKGYCVFGSDGGSQVRVDLPPSSVELSEPVKLSAVTFQKAINGRRELSISTKDGVLQIRAKGYAADLAVMEVSESITIEPEGETQTIEFTAASWAWFSSSVQALQIETVPGMELTFLGKVGKKSVLTAVYDASQIAFQMSSASEFGGEPFEIALPYERIARVLRGLPFADNKLLITPGGIYVINKMLRAFLPLVAEEAAVTPQDIIDKVKEIVKIKGGRVELDNDALKTFLSNASSVSNGTAAAVAFSQAKGAVALKAASSSGSVKSLLAGKCTQNFSLDLRFLVTLSSKVNKDVQLTVTDSMLIAKAESGDSQLYYVTALQTEEVEAEEEDDE